MAKKNNGLFWLFFLIGTPIWLLGKTQPEKTIKYTTPPFSQTDIVAPIPAGKISLPPVVSRNTTKEITARIPSTKQNISTQREFRFMLRTKVNVRSSPDTKSDKVTTLSQGTKVIVLEEAGDWTRIQTGETEGYVQKKYLVTNKLLTITTPLTPPATKPNKVVKPSINTSSIVKQIIANSIASYSGRCPCPYHSDRAGRSCGRRSAYSRAGGASVICYAEDVTDEMIATFN